MPTTFRPASTTGRSPTSYLSMSSSASAHVAFSGTVTTFASIMSRTRGQTSLT